MITKRDRETATRLTAQCKNHQSHTIHLWKMPSGYYGTCPGNGDLAWKPGDTPFAP